MANKKRIDPVSEAALETVNMQARQEELQRQEQSERERLIAQCHQIVGRVQSNLIIGKFAAVSNLMHLKQIKESKIYRDLPAIGTWDKYCEYIGLSRQKVDEDLINLAAFGEDFLLTCQQFSFSYRDLRKLRQLTNDGAISIEDDVVTIGGEDIPLTADHREDLQAALERIIDAKDALIAEKNATLRAKDRIIEAKEDVIGRQEKELAKLEGKAEKAGFMPGEEAFIQKCRNSRLSIDGLLMEFDPERRPLPDDATPRMKAEYMETLGYFLRTIRASYDTAGDVYGDHELDSPGWVQPNLRPLGDALAEARKKREA